MKVRRSSQEADCADRSPRKPSLDSLDTVLVAVLILCATLPYLNTLFNGFVYDDNRQVLDNPYLKSFHYLPKVFGTTVWSFVGAQGVSNYYRPMMTLGYLFCYQMFGPLAYGFHLVNISLNAGVVCLVFVVARRMFHDRALAFVAACLFAFHPIHTEAVAWIAAVTDLEVTFFYLLTFWLFLNVARPEGKRSAWVELVMVASFALTIVSKEQSLTLPLVTMVYEHFYRDDRSQTTWSQKAGRYGVLWLMDGAYVLFRVQQLGAFAPQIQMARLGWYPSVLSALVLVGQYAGKLLWPWKLCAYYVFHKGASVLDPRVMMGIGVLLACAAIVLALWRRSRTASFGFVWFFATLAPVLDVRFLAGNVFAERYLYLPSVGFCWLAGWAGVWLWRDVFKIRPFWRRTFVAAGGLIAVLFAVRVVARNRVWHDDRTLYMHTLKVSPDAIHIRENLGVVDWDHGNLEGAERQWRIALEINPNDPIALNNLGLVYAKRKQYEEAEHYFRQAILRKPNYTDPHLNLGSLDLDLEKYEAAEWQLRAAVALSPLIPSCHNKLGKLYLEEERLSEAEREFSRSVAADPNFEGYDGLGDVYLKEAKSAQAEQSFASAVVLNPFDAHAHFGLAGIAASSGRRAVALMEYAKGLETDPNNPEAKIAVQKLRLHAPNE
ncbi:MAG TPA: tetratricopeptide repeat protein [Terriglobia bacterium]|nr:tetratricopeptide repeat protein [Terriglobia bacterium]